MTHYVKQGSIYKVTDSANIDIRSKLPVGTYQVGLHPDFGYYLDTVEDMSNPAKLYGPVTDQIERFMATYMSRQSNTGILLTGEKGSGKTLMLRALSKWSGDAFNKFIQSIDQPCMLSFDEFDKVYGAVGRRYGEDNSSSEQDQLLSIMDGTFGGKKLFVFTANRASYVSKHMMNRPGRIFYHVKYRGLEEGVIDDYCQEVLKNKEHIKSVHVVATQIDGFNFDMLKGIVEEMNRYGEEAPEAVALMNIAPESSSYVSWTAAVTKDGHPLDRLILAGTGLHHHPLSHKQVVINMDTGRKDGDGDTVWENLTITRSHFLGVRDGDLHFEVKQLGHTYNIAYQRDKYADYAF